ncbi:MAG: hypothetical protein JOY68_05335 [Candidatus Dormibacteraeota bacterium]|nr:hypothetical protein [Candidatus Dormibacteraeota bacterium]
MPADDITLMLTGAGGSACANVIDALRLSEHRYRIIGLDCSAITLQLSAADSRHVIPRADEPGYIAAVRDIAGHNTAALLHAQPDPEVMMLGRHRGDVGVATYLPPQRTLEVAADKSACAAMLAAAGVPVPEAVPIASLDSAAAVVDDLLQRHERVWIRARHGAGSRASLPVRSATQAIAWISWWIEERGLSAGQFMASEMLPGREFAFQSVWQDGEIVAGQSRERVAYLYGHLTPSGQTSTPSVARTVRAPHVDETAIAAIRALDPQPHGVFCVDMKERAGGDPRVTEVNAGRFFTTSNFFAHAGLNMPDLMVRCALGERPQRRGVSPLPEDLYWIRMVDMGFRLVTRDDIERLASADH